MFFQEPWILPDPFANNSVLQRAIRGKLSETTIKSCWPKFESMGQSVGQLESWATQAERQPPKHIPYDPFGRRVDQIEVSDGWKQLNDFAAKHGIVGTGYDEKLGAEARLVQTVLLYLYSASSAIYSCPLAMTDAAAAVLDRVAPKSLRERLVPRLLSYDPKTFITSGQWMTERTGGSDIGRSETRAQFHEQVGDEARFRLFGVKWFTSATTAEMALTLAKIEGQSELTLFCVELERTAQGISGIQINRFKDKLGTRALPTAELTLDGVVATQLGEPGRGVANISQMLNITRYYNAVASASLMAKGVAMAKDYASKRTAFGKRLIDHPLHARTLSELESISNASVLMCLELAELLGHQKEPERLRALVPITKLLLGKQAVAVASECLECFGGAGYVEDTGLPVLLRDAQVLPIWEGTTNVLSLDLLRAERKEKALSVFLANLNERAGKLDLAHEISRLECLNRLLQKDDPEPHARKIAMTAGLVMQEILWAEAGMRPAVSDL